MRFAASRARVEEIVDRLESTTVGSANLIVFIQTVLQLNIRETGKHLITVDATRNSRLALAHHAKRSLTLVITH